MASTLKGLVAVSILSVIAAGAHSGGGMADSAVISRAAVSAEPDFTGIYN